MVKFREHRGSLQESLKTTVELASMGELKKFCLAKFADAGLDERLLERLVVTQVIYDDRCGWDTHIVFIPGWGVLGFTDGQPE